MIRKSPPRSASRSSDSNIDIDILAIAFHSLVLAILIKFVPQGCDRPRARAAVWRCDAAGRNRGILSVPRKLSGLAAQIKNLCFEYRRHQRNPRFSEFCTFDCAFAAP